MYINELINLLIFKEVDSLFITRKASQGKDFFEYGPVKMKRIRIGPEAQWDKNNLDNLEEDIKDKINAELQLHRFIPDLIHSIYWHPGERPYFFLNSSIFHLCIQ